MRVLIIFSIFLMMLLTGCNSSESQAKKNKPRRNVNADDRFREGVYHKSSGIRW